MNTLTQLQAQSLLNILIDVPLRNLLEHPHLVNAIATLEQLAKRSHNKSGDPINRDVTYDIYLKIVPTLGKVSAIKAIRACTNWGLKKTKEMLEDDILSTITPETEYVIAGPFIQRMHWSGVDDMIDLVEEHAFVFAIPHLTDPDFPYVVVDLNKE